MANPSERPETAPRRVEGRAGTPRTMDGRPVEELTTAGTRPDRQDEAKQGTGVAKFFGLELGMFATAVILAVIFVAAIIIFAAMR